MTFSPFPGTPRAALRTRLLALGLLGASLVGGLAQAEAPSDYATASFTRTYHGGDGSVMSMRHVGNQVVGFSQDISGDRSYVFIGQHSGQTLTGNYVMLPRGENKSQKGPLTLSWSQAGSRLDRQSGDNLGTPTWVAKLPSTFTFPQGGPARWQSTSATDMDGAYRSSDGSRIWVRQLSDGEVLWYAERFNGTGASRPTTATVGVAQRGAQGQLSGQWWDLPSQTSTLNNGYIAGAMSSGSRDFTLSLVASAPGTPARGNQYSADYAIDLDRFEQEIRDRATPFAVGFSYAIARDGNVVRKFAGGARRTPTADNGMQDPISYSIHTLGDVASTSKTVTAVAVLKALRDKGVSVDSPVSPYLPMDWVRGPGMSTVTFRQLLSHGLKPVAGKGLLKPENCSDQPYNCLRTTVANGLTEKPGYNNIHYVIFRMILPMLRDPVATTLVCTNQANDGLANECISTAFRDHIRDLLSDVGVDADFKYVYGPGESGAYLYAWGNPPTGEKAPLVAPSESYYLEAGSGGLKIKPSEYAQFLSRLQRGDILGAADMTILRDISYGGTAPFPGPDGVGSLWTKNGGFTGTSSQLMVYPGTEVFYSQNSTGHPNQPGLASMLRDAWAASLVGAP